MSEAINTEPVFIPTTTTAAVTPASNTASNATGGNYTAATTISNVAELKDKAPEVYNAMLQGIAQSICSRMKDAQDRLKEMGRKARNK